MRPGCIFAVLALLGAFWAGPVAAQYARGAMPLDQILPEIRRSHPGQLFDAEGPVPGPGGSLHYRLKWMTPDGRIEWLNTDARTGRVLGASPGPRPGRSGFSETAPPFSRPLPPYAGSRRFPGRDSGYAPRVGNGRGDRGAGLGRGGYERERGYRGFEGRGVHRGGHGRRGR